MLGTSPLLHNISIQNRNTNTKVLGIIEAKKTIEIIYKQTTNILLENRKENMSNFNGIPIQEWEYQYLWMQ